MQMLWTDGVFLTKQGAAGSGIPRRLSIEFEKGGEQWQQRPPIGSFEYRLEAARRAGIVREILLGKLFRRRHVSGRAPVLCYTVSLRSG